VVAVVVAGVTCTLVVLLATELLVGAAWTVSVRVTVWVGSVTVRVSVELVVVVGAGSVLVELLTSWVPAVEAVCPACLAPIVAPPDPQAAINPADPAASASVTLPALVVNRISSWWSP
jgi:hypothetical protein